MKPSRSIKRVEGNEKAYKFCVQHLSHFLELVLKYYVTTSHPLLIYKNPFAKNVNDESQTIGLHDAINFLKNEGYEISEKFATDLRWLKDLRNKIEHHKFAMNADEVRETIGRLMSAVVELDETHESIDLSSHMAPEHYDLFHKLANTYEGRVAKAQLAVKEAQEKAFKGLRPKEQSLVHFAVYRCYECGHDTIIANGEAVFVFRCTFCGNEASPDIEVECDLCSQRWPIGEMNQFRERDTGELAYTCPRCWGTF
jgi:hypothetical protein